MYESTMFNSIYVSIYLCILSYPIFSNRILKSYLGLSHLQISQAWSLVTHSSDPGVVGVPAFRRCLLGQPLPCRDLARPPPRPLAAALRKLALRADAGAGDAAQK